MFFQNETFGKTKLFPKKNLVPGVGWGGGGGAGILNTTYIEKDSL